MISKESVKTVLLLACCITTALVLFIGIQGVVSTSGITFGGWDLLKLVSVGFASTLPSLLLIGRKKDSRLIRILLLALHFILTAGAVFGLLILYEWIDAESALYTTLMFLIIYVAAYAGLELRSHRLAKKLNERINAFHNTENETHGE